MTTVFWIAAAAALLLAGIWLYRFRRSRRVPTWIRPKTTEVDHPVFGRCRVQLPVVGQNYSRGFVKCSCEVDGNTVDFKSGFVDETGGTIGLDEAISKLRHYYLLATNPEQMKIFKNALVRLVRMHNTLHPDFPITESELITTIKLSHVGVECGDDQATFWFFSKGFLQGRPIIATIGENGEVTSVGAT